LAVASDFNKDGPGIVSGGCGGVKLDLRRRWVMVVIMVVKKKIYYNIKNIT